MPEIGTTLREARMRARIDVSEIEEQTKIRARYLRALENEEWGLLPGPAYTKSFLRAYAQALGLDGRALVEEYKAAYERAERRRAGRSCPSSAGLPQLAASTSPGPTAALTRVRRGGARRVHRDRARARRSPQPLLVRIRRPPAAAATGRVRTITRRSPAARTRRVRPARPPRSRSPCARRGASGSASSTRVAAS